jgi:hypothetical protein
MFAKQASVLSGLVALASVLAGCQMDVAESGAEDVGSIESALETCHGPGLNAGTVCDLVGGSSSFR